MEWDIMFIQISDKAIIQTNKISSIVCYPNGWRSDNKCGPSTTIHFYNDHSLTYHADLQTVLGWIRKGTKLNDDLSIYP